MSYSDFTINLVKVKTEEADTVANYLKLIQENKVMNTLKEQDVKFNTQEFKSLSKQDGQLEQGAR